MAVIYFYTLVLFLVGSNYNCIDYFKVYKFTILFPYNFKMVSSKLFSSYFIMTAIFHQVLPKKLLIETADARKINQCMKTVDIIKEEADANMRNIANFENECKEGIAELKKSLHDLRSDMKHMK